MLTVLRFPRSEQEVFINLPQARTSIEERHGLNVQSVAPDCRPADVAELLAFWRPDACLVNNDRLPARLFAGIPAVFSHRGPEKLLARHARIAFDERAVAEAAARELLGLGLAAFAFVPTPNAEFWCRQRERHFTHLLGINGHGHATYRPPSAALSPLKRQKRLREWLAGLPKPLGVFAANDLVAVDVLAACAQGGLDVPGDVAVVGVDNAEAICESRRPTLSSVSPDLTAFMEARCALLRRLLDEEVMPEREVLVAPSGVVRRASTLRFTKSDPVVVAACDLIRRRACDGLKVADVARLFPCGRRMAEIRFHAAMGHSMHEEIRAVRRAKARELRALGSMPRELIAASCGYAAWSSVHRLLKTSCRT